MRRSVLLAALVVGIAPALLAATDNQATKPVKPATATITGCLSGPNDEGVFELKTTTTTVEVGGFADLKDHVGHEVKLTGTWVKTGAEIGEKEDLEKEAKEAKEAQAKEAKGKVPAGSKVEKERHLKVSNVQHIADNCNAMKK